MKKNIFSIPFYHYQVKDWYDKKLKLIELFESTNTNIQTNVQVTPHNLKTTIFDEEIEKFQIESEINVKTSALWFQKYYRGMNHDAHTHGIHGFSSICFIEYDEHEHSSPVFLSPFLDVSIGLQRIYCPKVNEGDIIFFPSNLMHYVPVNKSDRERLVVSFNLRIIEKKEFEFQENKLKGIYRY